MIATAGHVLWRSLALVFLGVFLRSVGRNETNFTFEDTLSQIGLGYPVLFLLGLKSHRFQWISLGVILVGYWLLFIIYPAPGPAFDYAQVGVRSDWPHHLTGLGAHFNLNSNAAWAFDRWFLNLWPRSKEWLYNGGGYSTLSFIPTLGTMLIGLLAGGVLKQRRPDYRMAAQLAAAGIISLFVGWLLDTTGLCPVVKKIWTPSWTLFSGGWCLLFLAGFVAVIDVRGWSTWSFPLRIIGMNSIAIYCLVHLIDGFILSSFRTHLGKDVFQVFGETFEPVMAGSAALAVFWIMLYWMHRRRLYLRL